MVGARGAGRAGSERAGRTGSRCSRGGSTTRSTARSKNGRTTSFAQALPKVYKAAHKSLGPRRISCTKARTDSKTLAAARSTDMGTSRDEGEHDEYGRGGA